MMKQTRPCVLAVSLLIAALVAGVPAKAGDEDGFAVSGELVGKAKKSGGVKDATDLSGIACAEPRGFPRHCLLIDDETQSAQFVMLKEHSIIAGSTVPLTDARLGGKPLEFDGEGVGYGDGAFYVIGSHGHPRDKEHALTAQEIAERTRAVSIVARIAVPPAGNGIADDTWPGTSPVVTRSDALRPLLAADRKLAPFVDQRLDQNGLTIEGVAIRDGRLYAGLRGPVLENGTRAAIFQADLDGLFEGKAANPKLFELPLGQGRGVRDLVRYEDGFLVLAGPSDDPAETLAIPSDAYSVFWWDRQNDPKPLGDIEGVKVTKKKWAKPEGLLPLDSDGDRLRLLVLFDGAPADKAVRVDKVEKP